MGVTNLASPICMEEDVNMGVTNLAILLYVWKKKKM